jgi:hypothetical protein
MNENVEKKQNVLKELRKRKCLRETVTHRERERERERVKKLKRKRTQ